MSDRITEALGVARRLLQQSEPVHGLSFELRQRWHEDYRAFKAIDARLSAPVPTPGEACGGCRGKRWVPLVPGSSDLINCPTCNGTGRAPTPMGTGSTGEAVPPKMPYALWVEAGRPNPGTPEYQRYIDLMVKAGNIKPAAPPSAGTLGTGEAPTPGEIRAMVEGVAKERRECRSPTGSGVACSGEAGTFEHARSTTCPVCAPHCAATFDADREASTAERKP